MQKIKNRFRTLYDGYFPSPDNYNIPNDIEKKILVDIICMELHKWQNFEDNISNVENHLQKTHKMINSKNHAGHRLQVYRRN